MKNKFFCPNCNKERNFKWRLRIYYFPIYTVMGQEWDSGKIYDKVCLSCNYQFTIAGKEIVTQEYKNSLLKMAKRILKNEK